MARSVRPRTLAAVFGVYFLIVATASWTFARGLTSVWYTADITRWVYTTYMLVAAIFLVGLGGMGLSVRKSFGKQIRELDAKLGPGSHDAPTDALPPPLPETTNLPDHIDRDIDELLESLSEVEASAAREAQAMEVQAETVNDVPVVEAAGHEPAAQRAQLVERRKFLGRYLAGPGIVAAVVLGISGIMLPGSDVFAQSNFTFNTAVILGIGYSWLGLGAYVAATVAALVSSKSARKGQ